MRKLKLAAGVVLLAALAGCLGGGDDEGDSDDGGDGSSGADDETGDSDTDIDDPSVSDTDDMLSLSALADWDPPYMDDARTAVGGSGYGVSDDFELLDGLVAFVYEHDGESNFLVQVLDAETGGILDVVANENGTVTGAAAEPAAAGEYTLEVTADGDWEIVIVQPSPPQQAVRTPPVATEDSGSGVVGPVALTGGETLTASHDGGSNFIVEVFDDLASTAEDIELAVNQIGAVDDAATSLSLEELVWVDVTADGNWSLSIE